ncbi:MAG: ParA family protein [Desulfovibrionaceae bacterium]|nr:ParA family protein [Desulfovibrionaceae bacterium]MDD4951584.1 ParA family protein [Desulfovibrionaceae bacterium]
MAARVLAVANQKGGVGKTTTALSLGAALGRMGRRVLVMDLDPHANASIHLAYYPEELEHTACDLFLLETASPALWPRVIKRRPDAGFDFVPGGIRLSELEVDLRERKSRGLILRTVLEAVGGDYDYILLDCPPHVGVLLVNAIVASDLVLIPIQTDFLALYGIRLLFDTIRLLNGVLPRPVRFMALATMHDRRAGACVKVLRMMRKKLGARVFETVINLDTKFREACAEGKLIFEIDDQSRGAVEYMLLAKEVVAHEEDS